MQMPLSSRVPMILVYLITLSVIEQPVDLLALLLDRLLKGVDALTLFPDERDQQRPQSVIGQAADLSIGLVDNVVLQACGRDVLGDQARGAVIERLDVVQVGGVRVGAKGVLAAQV